MNDHKGLLGLVASWAGWTATILPAVNQVVQLIAGVCAIIASTYTIAYYVSKRRRKTLLDVKEDSTEP